MDTYSTDNINRIRELACDLRQTHDAMCWGVNTVDLIKLEGVNYNEYNLNEEGFLRKITKGIKKISEKIRAVFSIKENIVLIDENLHNAKKPFGQAHELGHKTIPEHREILYVCSELDLNPKTRKEMEFEANIFASETLIPSPLLEKIYREYPLSFETILLLNNFSGASIQSSAIRYVESCDKGCCLLTLKPEKDSNGNDILRLISQLWSTPWHKKYKKKIIRDKQVLPASHNLAQIAFSVLKNNIGKTNISIDIDNEKKIFNAHTFYNGYLVLALIY